MLRHRIFVGRFVKPFVRPSLGGSRSLSSFPPRKNVNITHSPVSAAQEHLFSEDFLRFLREVSGEFQPQYRRVSKLRDAWQQDRLNGQPLTLRADTAWIRNDNSWKGPSIVAELERRHVEITGPAGDPKMVINALNSGADAFMADLEDSQAPSWQGLIQGHQNSYQAVRGDLTFESKSAGLVRKYAIDPNPSTLIVRVRGLHMYEEHVIDECSRPIPGSLFDLGMYLFHNANELKVRNLTPLFYVAKLQSFEDATLIHDVIQQMESRLNLPYGTVRVTALIETLEGIIEAEEIGFALGPYWAGLNCGRWDYIFSTMKSQPNHPDQVLPDRNLLKMELPFLTNYMKRIVQISHKRSVHALGGMSAFNPVKDAKDNASVLGKVVADKEYEIAHGCDGAWVAHPGMVKPIQAVFPSKLNNQPNQIKTANVISDQFFAEDFVVARGTQLDPSSFSEAGLRTNISVSIQYLSNWLSGRGCVAINGLMEDMATAEISRTQVWQWLKHGQAITLANGTVKALDHATYQNIFHSEVANLKRSLQSESQVTAISRAAEIFDTLVTSHTIQPFIQDSLSSLLNETVEKPEKLKFRFVAHPFSAEEQARLRGTRADITLDGRLAINRGTVFNEKMSALRTDGMAAHGSFIGTPNGHSARNVV